MTGTVNDAARRVAGLVFIIVAVAALGGCGISTLTSSFNGGMFGGSKPEPVAPAAAAAPAKVSEGNLLTAAQNNAGGQVDAAAPGGECPTLTVSPGDNNITYMAKGGNNDGLSVMHRGEISTTARECSPSLGGGLSVKFGFSGRVLLGPQGKPGTVTLPVKITVMDGNRATLKAEQVKVPVTIAADQPVGFFSVVREVLVPIPPGASPRSYRILVAFDRKAPGAS